jgi:hypothetical protein
MVNESRSMVCQVPIIAMKTQKGLCGSEVGILCVGASLCVSKLENHKNCIRDDIV